MAFATVAEFELDLRQDLTGQADLAQRLLDKVTALVQGRARQTIAAVAADTVTLVGRGDPYILLPQVPVTDVTAVTVDGTALTSNSWRWYRDGRLYVSTASSANVAPGWTADVQVQVTYDHGYDPVPDELRELVLDIAGRLWRQPDTGLAALTLGDYSVTYSRATDSGVFLPDEVALVDRYRRDRIRSVPVKAAW